MISARSSVLASIRSLSLRSTAARSLADTSRQAFWALSAAAMARSVSAVPHIGTVPSFSPLAGLVTRHGLAVVGIDPLAGHIGLLLEQGRVFQFEHGVRIRKVGVARGRRFQAGDAPWPGSPGLRRHRVLDRQREQEADHVAVDAAGQQQQAGVLGALLHLLGEVGIGRAVGLGEFDRHHAAQAAHVADRRHLGAQGGQAVASASCPGVSARAHSFSSSITSSTASADATASGLAA